MKQSKLFTCGLLLCTTCIALNASITVKVKENKNKNTIALDKVQYRITYEAKAVLNDTTATDSLGRYLYSSDEMRLDIGDKVNVFYNYTQQVHDSIVNDLAAKGNYDMRNAGKAGAITWRIYKNYPEGKFKYLDFVLFDKYCNTEAIENPQWNIVPDSTKEIMGYQCQMAETFYKGRHWTAWYTDDIPLDCGPWKLGGLPGLILQAQDQSKQYIFTGIGLQNVAGKEAIEYKEEYNQYEEIKLKQFAEIKRKSSIGDILKGMGKNVKIEVHSNTPNEDIDTQKLLNQTDPYNPIEE